MPDLPEITIVEFHAPITITDFQNLPDLPFDIHVRSSGFLAQFDRISLDRKPCGGTALSCEFLGAEPTEKVCNAVYSRVHNGIMKRFNADFDADFDMIDFETDEGFRGTLCRFCKLVEEVIIAAVTDRAALL